jgi:hypothetical protein
MRTSFPCVARFRATKVMMELTLPGAGQSLDQTVILHCQDLLVPHGPSSRSRRNNIGTSPKEEDFKKVRILAELSLDALTSTRISAMGSVANMNDIANQYVWYNTTHPAAAFLSRRPLGATARAIGSAPTFASLFLFCFRPTPRSVSASPVLSCPLLSTRGV